MAQIKIQANAKCSWFRKCANFKNKKLIMMRAYSAGASAGCLLAALVIKFVMTPETDISLYLGFSAAALLLSLFAHMRMQFSGENSEMILTNIHDYLIDTDSKQVYMCGATGNTPFFSDVGFVLHVANRQECQITFSGPANKKLIKVLEERYFGNASPNKKYLDFVLTISIIQAEFEQISNTLNRKR